MIDWDFIAEQEGNTLEGYVPDPAHSHSGVTVASGVDIGQMTHAELTGFTPQLMAKLLPYVGLKGEPAVEALKAQPLTITADEATALNQHARQDTLNDLRHAYLMSTKGRSFDTLPDPVQTVVASVTFQYGSPWSRTPHFWGYVTSYNYAAMVADLKHFGDKYQPRHDREAAYLQAKMGINWTEGKAGA